MSKRLERIVEGRREVLGEIKDDVAILKKLAAANRRVAGLEAALAWTTEPPKAPGWYWIHEPAARPRIVGVTSFDLPIDSWSGWANARWAGPIPEPAEAKEERR